MDTLRMNDLIELQSLTGMPIYYIVREVSDQEKREFLRWRSISLDTFSRHLGSPIEGGTGMGYESGSYPTKVCSKEYFQTIK